jgi:hypothetical protein
MSFPRLGLALSLAAGASLATSACAPFNALGRGPAEVDLQNDGSDEAQSALARSYEVVYERGVIRRPGADPIQVAADIHVSRVDDVAAPAWSDDAYNYLSSSDTAVEIMDDPAIAFDQFAHSGAGELLSIGTGFSVGIIVGGLTWFIPTRVADGVSADEQVGLITSVMAGAGGGAIVGGVFSAAYAYIVPSVSTPMATPLYRKAVRAFNQDLEEAIVESEPDGDAPSAPEPTAAPEAAESASTPTAPPASNPPPTETPAPSTPATP